MSESFDGKVALVTGAGSGIGLATAKNFAQAGASVVLADRHKEAVRGAAGELIASGFKAIAVGCDVTDKAQVTAMIEQAVDTYGRLDAAFNNAGINCENAPLLERSDNEFDHIINVRDGFRAQYELVELARPACLVQTDDWLDRRGYSA